MSACILNNFFSLPYSDIARDVLTTKIPFASHVKYDFDNSCLFLYNLFIEFEHVTTEQKGSAKKQTLYTVIGGWICVVW